MSSGWSIAKIDSNLRGYNWFHLQIGGEWSKDNDVAKLMKFASEEDANNAIVGLTLACNAGEQLLAVKFDKSQLTVMKVC